ncbi:MAG: GNAT family N-acetyltransferase [Candidatus Dormibacteraeota bacterium]|nr:GNAT family N-acetyltransferase [Candidatus Dormibacteraeota bacterium]
MDLNGALVRLRAPRPGDAEALHELGRDPEVARFAGSPSLLPETLGQVRDLLAARSPDRVRWVIEATADGAVLGSASLNRIDLVNRHCWFGIVIGPPARWGRGCGTEATILATRFALRRLGLEKVYLGVFEGNERGFRAYQKAGYRLEATLARHHLLEGRLVAGRWMAAYRDDPLYAGSP